MARLYVGCRVRSLWSRPEIHKPGVRYAGPGAEGVISCRLPDDHSHSEWVVDWGGFSTAVLGEQVAPILPSGHQACDADFKRGLDKLLERQGVAA